MKVDVEEVSQCRRKLTIELDIDSVQKEYSRVSQEVLQSASVPGFRKGKVPMAMIKSQYGGYIREKVINTLIPINTQQALQEKQIQPVAQPFVESLDLEEGKPLLFTLVVDIQPNVELKTYKQLDVEKSVYNVEDNHVEESLKRVQDSYAQYEIKEGTIEWEDYALVDYIVTAEGKTVRKMENTGVAVVKDDILPELNEGLIGMAAGEQKTVSVTLPENYEDNQFSGKQASVEVKVNEVKIKKLPELNDDFAKDLGEFENLQQLKDKIKEDLTTNFDSQSKNELQETLVKKLIELNTFEVPESLVEQQSQHIAGNMSNQMKSRGLSEENIKSELMRLNDSLKARGEHLVKMQYLFEAIAQKENIEVKDEDLNVKLEELAKMYRQNVDVIKEQFEKNGTLPQMSAQLRDEKILDFLIDNANIKEKVVAPDTNA